MFTNIEQLFGKKLGASVNLTKEDIQQTSTNDVAQGATGQQ